MEEETKKGKVGGGDTQRWKRILKMPLEEAKQKYQVLCANANWIKRHENGEQN